jgi:hypothetical protein
MKDRRVLEANGLQFTEFNRRHRDLFIKLQGSIAQINAEMEKKIVGEE